MSPLLIVSELRKVYDEFVAVDSVSFDVGEGEVFGLLGPNGAGKSTTMMMVCGLLQPDGGSVMLQGQPLDPSNLELRTLLGVVPQDLAIYPDLTGRENLDFFARLYKVAGAERRERVNDALQRVGLVDRADDLVGQYSGGMKRRLNFAVALLHRPLLLILDEPTVGVDPQSRAHLLDSVRQLRDGGMSVIYVSHYMEEVESLCDRVAIMDHGRMLACDGLPELLQRTSSELRLTVRGDVDLFVNQLPEWARPAPTATDTVQVVVVQDSQRNLQQDLAELIQSIATNDLELVGIAVDAASLERLFLDLTGHALRD
jgi:ABC-2 type transport system ATP-binding protein